MAVSKCKRSEVWLLLLAVVLVIQALLVITHAADDKDSENDDDGMYRSFGIDIHLAIAKYLSCFSLFTKRRSVIVT